MNRLILCAGETRRDGWTTVDASSDHFPDFLATIPPLPIDVICKQWDEVELVHGITSFYPWEAKTLLREIREVLAPGGKLVLEQPDFGKCDRLEWIFGDPKPQNPLHMVHWAYTPNSLEALVRDSGFEHCRQMEAQYHMPSRDFRIEAW